MNDDRRGKPDQDFIPTLAAWHRVAKMLFPEEPVRCLTKRDDWLISRYRLPPRHGPYGMAYPGFDDDDRIPAPPELIAEVDRAEFRRSLQNAVDDWFKERGFDPEAPTISKHLFEAAFQAEFGQLPFEPVKPVAKAQPPAPGKEPTPKKKHRKTKQQSRAGRPEEWDWEEGRLFVRRELERKGSPRKKENQIEGWKSVSDPTRLVVDHLSRNGEGPDFNAAWKKVNAWIKEFELEQN